MNSLIEEIYIYKNNIRLADSTIKSYSNVLNNFAQYLSNQIDVNIEQVFLDKVYLLKDATGIPIRYLPIDSALLDKYFKSLIPRGYYALHFNHSALMSFFSFLEKNYNFNNPLFEMEFRVSDYIPEKKYSKIFSRGDIIKFFNSVISHSDNLETDLLLFTILISTGCRISEILDLKCEDFDFENNFFIIKKPKNKHQRIVNLRFGMGEIIRIYISNQDKTVSDYLFTKINSGKRLNRTDVDKLLKVYLASANMPTINLHGFRHTFATLMADENTPITFIQQLLGHKSISSTRIYINPHYVRNNNINIPENKQVIDFLKNKIEINK